MRVVNVVDLMRLQSESEHPHGMPDREFDALFTPDKPVVFAYHGYPWLIHRLTYRRTNHHNLHVRGYKEEGTTTTPFDMVMLNDMDRYHLVIDVIDRVPGLGARAAGLRQQMVDERLRLRAYTREHGDDAPEVRDWVLPRPTRAYVRVLTVNTGSSSVKLRLLGPATNCSREHEATRPEPASTPSRCARRSASSAAPTRSRTASCTAAPARRGGADRRRRWSGSCTSWRRSRRCTSPRRSRRSRPRRAALPGRAGRRLLRHGVPRRRCRRRRRCTRCRAEWRERFGLRALRLPRALARLRCAPRRRAAAGSAATRASSRATSAPARRSRRSAAGARSTRRWASRRSRGS